MKVTFLGTGTSSGIPLIGCDCVTCASNDPKNIRTRSSVLITSEDGINILIDTAVEFREQVIKNKVEKIDAVFFTHQHADHIHGLDDIRFFNIRQGTVIPCYGSQNVMQELRRMYYYIFEDGQIGGGKPKISLNEIYDPFELFRMKITPIPLYHGTLPIFGYRINNLAYLTDVSDIPLPSMEKLYGLEVLVLGALRKTPHPTHFSLAEALEVVFKLRPEKAYLTHVGHRLEHNQTSKDLPDNVFLAYDSLVLELG